MVYLLLKYLHVIGAAVLFGTGAGIAFFMLMAHLTGKAATVAAVARIVVIADFVFTATAVVLQPLTGMALVWTVGYSLGEGWIVLSIILYLVTGAFWLPVVWMQIRMRVLAETAAAAGQPLPSAYHKLFWTWFVFGFPAFASVAAIFWLMIARPELLLMGQLHLLWMRDLGAHILLYVASALALLIGAVIVARMEEKHHGEGGCSGRAG